MSNTSSPALDAYRGDARAHLEQSIQVKQKLVSECLDDVIKFSLGIAEAMGQGKKLLICGNGGSAADAQHMSAELVVRLTSSFERQALPAMALTTDSSLLTACSNDYSYEDIFARQIQAFGQSGDIVLGITTSGNSGNVIKAFEAARQRDCQCYLLSGGTGGKLKGVADSEVIVPSPVTAHIQECHIAIIHIICDIIERHVCGKGH